MNGYPITLVALQDARCLVIGGGEVSARKVASLQAAGARPTVISPDLCAPLQQQASEGKIEAVRRSYQAGDLVGARLVIAATDDPETNEAVWQEAQSTGCLINVVDDPARCNFHVPATVRRGELTLSISTGGSSPLLASRIRRTLEEQFDEAYGSYLALLADLRPSVMAQIPDPAHRKALWKDLLGSEILDLLRSGQPALARQKAQALIDAYH